MWLGRVEWGGVVLVLFVDGWGWMGTEERGGGREGRAGWGREDEEKGGGRVFGFFSLLALFLAPVAPLLPRPRH